MNHNLKEYKEAIEGSSNFIAVKTRLEKEKSAKMYQIDMWMREEESKIREEVYNRKTALDKEYEILIENASQEKGDADDVRKEYLKTINYLIINKYCKLSHDYEVYKYDYAKKTDGSSDYSNGKVKYFYEKLDTFSNYDSSVSSYIIETKKPKNKWALVVIGNSIFSNEVGGFYPLISREFKSYGLNCNTEGDNIRFVVKEFATEKEARAYDIHKNKLFTQFVNEHLTLTMEYLEVVEECSTKEWAKEVLLHEKRYFEVNVSGGEDTDEYNEIVKQLIRMG